MLAFSGLSGGASDPRRSAVRHADRRGEPAFVVLRRLGARAAPSFETPRTKELFVCYSNARAAPQDEAECWPALVPRFISNEAVVPAIIGPWCDRERDGHFAPSHHSFRRVLDPSMKPALPHPPIQRHGEIAEGVGGM
jgi:hypothetical protein